MKKFLFALIGLTMLSACGGGDSDSGDSDNPMAGVYMSGATSEEVDANAILYKDGEITQLDASAISTSVFVTDSETYMSGIYRDGIKDKPCYWVGTSKINLTIGAANEGFATSIYVDGDDIYVGGYYDDSGTKMACYWKNGDMVDLGEGEVTAITVSGSDVYSAGYDDPFKPVYWKNTTKIALSALPGIAYDIKTDGTNVYTAGVVIDGNTIAVYWDGTTMNELTNGASDAVASSISMSGDDIYIAGLDQDYSKVVYWKNNSAGKVNMDSGSYVPMDSLKSWATPKIFVKDSDVYMSAPLGVNADDASVGGYWKNNDFSTPAGGLYSAIFVK